jgi:outer membrane autotransporter protein
MLISQAAETTTIGYIHGIYANNGGGSLTINALGTSVGEYGSGIYAINHAGTTGLFVTANNASGAVSGVETRSYGSGGATITLTGTAQGGSGAAIDTFSGDGTPICTAEGCFTEINLLDGSAARAGSSGIAIRNNVGNSIVKASVLSRIYGGIHLGHGSDLMTILAGLDISDVTVLDGGDDSSAADGMIDVLTFDGWQGQIDGQIVINWEQVVLSNSAVMSFGDALTVGFSPTGTAESDMGLFVRDASTLQAFGGFTLQGNLLNAGFVTTSDGTVGDDLSVVGNYSSESGTLMLDTFLGEDTSPSDVLVISGTASGLTNVVVNNFGGPGALTDVGIRIVDVGDPAGSPSDSFVLANGDYTIARTGETALLAGAYGYALRQGASDGDWYLQSEWQPASPVYEVYPSILLDQIGMPRLQERVGNRHWAQPAAAPAESVYVFCKDPAQNFRCAVTPEQADVYAEPVFGFVGSGWAPVIEGQGLWARAEGSVSRYRPVESTTGASYEAQTGSVQIGYDHVLLEAENGGRLIGGLNLTYGTLQADVTSDIGLGEISTEGYGLGASLTWYAKNGFYVDAQAQVMSFDSDLSADGLGTFADGHKSDAYGVSVELGQEIALDETWTITPQVQLSYAKLSENGFTDAYDNIVVFDAESLLLRLGVEVSHEESWEAEDGTTSRRSLRAGAHVFHEFKPETQVVVAGTPLRSKRETTLGEITLGGTYNWSDDRNSLYSEVGAGTGLDNFGDSYRVRATVGFRRQWE